MIKQVSHSVTAADPAGFALALEVAYELHAPAPRAPEVAVSGTRARRTAAARTRSRTVRG
ncbi:hypothetical protein [Streptomyces sp. GESEQ-35]|uniref:hypothetical protein n=1 Tax=Streptomyces sp. GESEQ-35 TaxID=2812657 RepID=UPI001B3196F6|nr:hypothetical protein [Streptomyces sp. GESEQ-35]